MIGRVCCNLLLWAIGILWALAGVSKLIDPLWGSDANQQATWASSFPHSLMILVALFECVIALLIFARFRWIPLIAGSVLLSAFLAALWIWPMDYQQPCGCFGKIELFHAIDPVSKIIAFGGLNTLAAALTWACQADRGTHKKEHPEMLFGQ